jgi:putative phage-type endonuclease
VIEQGTPEWRAERAGRITASRFVDVLGTRPAREKYARELVFERLAQRPKHEVKSKSTAWGTDIEPFHVEAFELHTGLIAERCGLIAHPRYPFIAASPDRLTSDGGGLECKAPHDEAVHVQTWLEGMPDEHRAQVLGGMFVTGRTHWWFTSYDPRQAEPYRLYVERVPRDDRYIATLSGALLTFEQEVQAMLEQIRNRAAQPTTTESPQ